MHPSPNSSRRVVITGMSVISPVGNTLAALWDALCAGRSGIARWERASGAPLPDLSAGQARDFSGRIEDFGSLDADQKKLIRKGLKVMCRETQMGVAAAQLALHDAHWRAGVLEPERCGVVFGSDYMVTQPEEFASGVGKCADAEGRFDYSRWSPHGMGEMNPLWLLKYLPNMPASHIAIYNDLRGPNNSITMREAGANVSLGEAFRVIARGHADMMLSGATGTRVHPMKAVHAALCEELAQNGQSPESTSRPFDLHRTGMVLGEGAGAVVLESLDSATARGARIYAEVVGASSSSVADNRAVAHRETAMTNVLKGALRDAGMKPEQIGHVHAHGLSTRSCDTEEARAIRNVFGSLADTLSVTAAKSYFGNLGAASGLVELAASVLALSHGRLFKVLNYSTPDPSCPIHPVQTDDVPPGDSFLNLSVTPQGQASCILVRRY